MKQATLQNETQLIELCELVRHQVEHKQYENCIELIVQAMLMYPHAPHPHNLLGIVLERQGDHAMAMNHFRAALALDATYQPARLNLSRFGSFFSVGTCAFNENDCPNKDNQVKYEIEFDDKGVGHVVRSK